MTSINRRGISTKKILLESTLSSTRLWLTMGSIIWALLLFWPNHLFTPARTTYTLMAKVAPEEVWGLAFLIQGVWAFYTLRTGSSSKLCLVMDAFLGCILWTSSTLLCFMAHWPHASASFFEALANYPPPAAMSGEVIMSLASWWHLVRFWADHEEIVCKIQRRSCRQD